jgi:hypothetical protein
MGNLSLFLWVRGSFVVGLLPDHPAIGTDEFVDGAHVFRKATLPAEKQSPTPSPLS